ncbi:RNA methyltransferase [Arsenicicoccus piscis]|uniref:RNA methyltransferase n=1 Tax=Arsenicicoccus piscis TaxID=673954 RepID=A0ABQ6HN06_9MICO|nr:RNA methyltransferase [Arsenicicoccus piscis]GMA18990.1 RNA methyltransferase [Arsenicicoccus piscis]
MTRRVARSREGAFLVEGPQGVREAVRHRPDLVREVYVTDAAAERYRDVLDDADDARIPVIAVDDAVLAAMADAQTPQGLLAVVRTPRADLDAVLAGRPQLLCVLTHVRDPGNAGTVLRTADAVGADAVLVSEGSVDVLNPKVVRSTVGSLFHLPVVTDLGVDEILTRVGDAGIRLLAADGHGTRLLTDPGVEAELREPHAWVFGNEAWGMAAPTRDRCDEVVRVPIHGHAESLNLAMAATICLYSSARAQHPG